MCCASVCSTLLYVSHPFPPLFLTTASLPIIVRMQGMLDFDFMCGRKKPSVAAMVRMPSERSDDAYDLFTNSDSHPNLCSIFAFVVPLSQVFPFNGNHYTKLYWGTDEALIPVYTTTAEAVAKHADATVMINFASFRSVYETVEESLNFSHQIKTIAIIAEGTLIALYPTSHPFTLIPTFLYPTFL